MATAVRLPGIQFDVVSPPAQEALVRMDIAAFVGFAASGPVNLPVAVENIPDFEEIFGNDLPLAVDPASNQPAYANLPSAVRAFFRDGGRRCWVVRVAGDQAATDLFPIGRIEGTTEIATLSYLKSGSLTPALFQARSPGSWADDLSAGIALRSEALVVTRFASNPYTVGLALQAPGQTSPGDLLRLTFPDTNDVLWLFVDSVSPDQGVSPPAPVQPGQMVTVTGATYYWQQVLSPPSGGLTAPPTSGTPVCELITMDLFVTSGAGDIWSITELGFAPANERYLGFLPSDACFYRIDTPTEVAADAAHPRFPLAAPSSGVFFLPIGAGPLPEFLPATLPPGDPLVRNGLAAFGADLFLEPALAETSSIDLMQKADYLRYQIPTVDGLPKPLRGIHAVLAIDEATIIAAPDAVQRTWYAVADEPLASPPQSSPLAHPEWWHSLDCRQQSPVPRTTQPPPGEFEPCDLLIVAAPQLLLVPPEGGIYSLAWPPMAGATDFLEEAVDPGFLTANVIYQGASGNVTIYGHPQGDYFYRLRRQIDAISSDYSNGIGLRVEVAGGWQVSPAASYQNGPLLSIHSALLRMCAARGDIFAVLAAPMHYRERDAMAHTAQLKATLGASEQSAYSFGALYFPWLTGREEDDLTELRSSPPDGAACGIFAKRSSERGAWIAPANEPLHGVVALAPSISRDYWLALQEAQVNLFRQCPGGYLCLSACTLSDDPDLSNINVRRLMSFLRKTVLKAGVDYVFEPNSNLFRRSVQRGFEKLLDRLFLRGAFAGRVASEGFQVATDSRVNTAAAIAQGRFYVEIKVAPSIPMQFLTVRLAQSADRTLVTEGP